ncbi:MAG: hypothetical protein NTU44_13350 [Bacteroidetes bacterium]|nr:hypothetical protein [Bacteroidota bacterium]
MKKSYLLFIFILFCAFAVKAQVNIYSTDFESFTVGSKVASSDSTHWTTWFMSLMATTWSLC